MTFFSTAADRFGERESELAQSLAARAALAVDNARLYRAAQEAVRTRDDVLAVVSHDLGNPLSAIRIGTSLLLRAMSEEERGTGGWQHLEAIRASTLQMERLIRDLLEVKRIEAGHLALQRRAVAPRALLSELREQFAAVAGEREITLEHELDETLPDVFADRDRTKQALSNLIGNALRFTPPGGRIVLEARAADHEVRFGVRDTGPGIPRDEAAHVFERFWQGRRDGQTGVGLGLAIARGIVQAHGGRIWVDSESGGGAHLLFTLPAFSGESEGGGAVRF
jgi:signal transduction histidine kinase